MAEDIEAEIDALLAAPRTAGPCLYVRVTTADIRAIIKERVERKQFNWSIYSKVLHDHGADVSPETIKQHFSRNHADDR